MRGWEVGGMARWSLAMTTLLLTVVAGCEGGDGIEPPVEVAPTMSIVSGGTGTDTIEADLAQALTVQVKRTNGKPLAGAIVRFNALPSAEPSRPGGDAIRLASLESFSFQYDVSDTTNASGRAFAAVKLGITAGKATIVVTVPEFGLRDSARFVVKAGRLARVLLSTHDTTTAVGRDVTIGAVAYDRRDNLLDVPLSYAIAGAACASGTTSTVRGAAIGSCWLRASAGTAVDSSRVAVLPAWTVVGYDYVTNEVVRLALATGVRTVIAQSPGYEVFPVAGVLGTVVFRGGTQLLAVRPDGVLLSPLVRDIGFEWMGWPRLSRDEQRVFFASSSGVYRSNIDGTGTVLLVPYATTPDPSRDGRYLTYAQNQELAIYDIATKLVTYPRKQGTMPRWSPTGDRIAFIWLRRVWVMARDGTGLRPVTPDSIVVTDNSGLDWSLDGEWILTNHGGFGLFRVDGSDQFSARLGTVSYVSIVR